MSYVKNTYLIRHNDGRVEKRMLPISRQGVQKHKDMGAISGYALIGSDNIAKNGGMKE